MLLKRWGSLLLWCLKICIDEAFSTLGPIETIRSNIYLEAGTRKHQLACFRCWGGVGSAGVETVDCAGLEKVNRMEPSEGKKKS